MEGTRPYFVQTWARDKGIGGMRFTNTRYYDCMIQINNVGP